MKGAKPADAVHVKRAKKLIDEVKESK